MVHKKLSILLAISFLVSSSTSTLARRAYSSYDYEHTKDTEIEYEPDSVQTKNAGYISDWTFLKTAEADATLKDTLLKQAEGGDVAAMGKLASMYFHGKGVERDLTESFKWNRVAAFKGNAVAQNNLGYMFDEGKGTKKDPAEALKWYRTAANFGNPNAQVNLGYVYEHGKGMLNDQKDYKLAAEWYQKAADQGNLIAKRNLYLFGQQGIKVGPSDVEGNTASIASTPFAPGTPDVATSAAAVSSGGAPAKSAPATAAQQVSKPAIVATTATAPATAKAATSQATPKTSAPATAASPVVTPAAVPVAASSSNPPAVSAAPTAAPPPKAPLVQPVAVASVAQPATQPAPAKNAATDSAAPSPSENLTAGSEKLTALLRKMSAQLPGAPASEAKPNESTVGEKTSEKPPEKVAEKVVEKAPEKVAEKAPEKVAAKAPEKIAEKAPERVAEKAPEKVKETVVAAPTAIAKEAAPTTKEVKEAPKAPPVIATATPAAIPAAPAPQVKEPEAKAPAALAQPATAASSTTTTTSSTAAASTGAVAAASSATPAAKDKASVRPIRDKWALVVGISQFDSAGIPKLDYSSKDATDFYNYLVNESNFAPDHVRLLLDDKATFRRVMSELGSKFLARVVKPDDLVLLYFSTHGSPSQMDIRGKNYLVAYDSDPNDLFATGIEMQKILESIQGRVLTDRVVLVMDACHSGFTEASAKGMGRVGNFNADELAQGSGQLVICSSEPTEQAWESTRYKNSVFTRKLLEGLRSKGPNTTLIEAYNATRRGVAEEVREDRAGVRQTPVLKGKWNGNDLIVAVPPASPQVLPLSVKKELEPDSASSLRSKNKIAETHKEAPKPIIAMVPPSSSKEVSKPKEETAAAAAATTATATASGDMVLTARTFYPDSDPKSLIRECYAALKSGSSRNNSELYYMRAQAYIQMNEWNNAMNDLTDAIHGTPNKAQFYLARAFVHHKLGQNIRAREDLDEARFADMHLPAKITFGD